LPSGALTFRTRFCHQILALKPAAIRGNASEILALAGMSAGGRGVDTTDTAASAVPLHRRWRGRPIPLWWSPARWITSPTGSVPER
jgi:hydroxyethylthiazole kinase-like sugar kinase family protein